MRKLLVTFAIVATLGFSANAQFQSNTQSDGFFSSTTPSDGYRTETGSGEVPALALPFRNSDANQPAPIGSGLLLLAGMGLAYAAKRKND